MKPGYLALYSHKYKAEKSVNYFFINLKPRRAFLSSFHSLTRNCAVAYIWPAWRCHRHVRNRPWRMVRRRCGTPKPIMTMPRPRAPRPTYWRGGHPRHRRRRRPRQGITITTSFNYSWVSPNIFIGDQTLPSIIKNIRELYDCVSIDFYNCQKNCQGVKPCKCISKETDRCVKTAMNIRIGIIDFI